MDQKREEVRAEREGTEATLERLKAERSKLQHEHKVSKELTRMSKAEIAKLQAAREENRRLTAELLLLRKQVRETALAEGRANREQRHAAKLRSRFLETAWFPMT